MAWKGGQALGAEMFPLAWHGAPRACRCAHLEVSVVGEGSGNARKAILGHGVHWHSRAFGKSCYIKQIAKCYLSIFSSSVFFSYVSAGSKG